MSNLDNITFLTSTDLIKIGMDLNIPVLISGDPGTGKTTDVRDIAQKSGAYCSTVVGSIREATEFAGVPFFNHKIGKLDYSDPEAVIDVLEGSEEEFWKDSQGNTYQNAILFLDELGTSHLDTMNAMLRLIDERVAGRRKISPRCKIVAATNFTNVTGNRPLQPALANRFFHVMRDPASQKFKEEWLYFMSTGHGLDNGIVAQPFNENKFLKYRALIASFIKNFSNTSKDANEVKNALHTMPEGFDSPEDYAFSTPRTLERCAKAMTMFHHLPVSLLTEVLSCLVGDTVATKLSVFCLDEQHITIDDIPDDQIDTFKLPTRPDLLDAFVAMLVANSIQPHKMKKVLRIYNRAIKQGAGSAMAYAKALADNYNEHMFKKRATIPAEFMVSAREVNEIVPGLVTVM